MSQTSKQSTNPMTVSMNRMVTTDPSTASLNAVMRHGGASFQNIVWRPISEGSSEYNPDNHDCLLPFTLDILNHKSLGVVSKKMLCHSLPNHAEPIVIYGAAPLVAPALEVETLAEVIQIGNSMGVEPQLHTMRVTSKHPATSATEETKSFDTLLFCSGLAIGNKPIIIGAALVGESDREDLVRSSLRRLLRQLCADQIVLSDIIQRCLQLPQLARVLIDAETGAMLWRNQVASNQWASCALPIKYLAQIRSEINSPNRRDESGRLLTLITLLRPKPMSVASDTEAPLATSFDISDGVRTRLSRVIENAVAPYVDNDASNTSEQNFNSRVAGSMKPLGDNKMKNDAQSKGHPEGEALQSTPNPVEKEDAPGEETEKFESARVALEVALRHLPEGGRMKLSPINSKGEVRVESFDINGEEAVDITVKNREFPESDEIL